IITSSATHAFLPYVKTEQAVRAQIENAVKLHFSHFGRVPKGIWLPECGYKEGLDDILKEYGILFFFTDTHGVLHADPKPTYDVYAPVNTPVGVVAFARDQETSKQVWSSLEGYPGDYDYREYYRDIGYDLDYDYVKPYLHSSGIRLNTGIKYYRITGLTDDKALYNEDWAREKAANHAAHFIFKRQQQIEQLSIHMDRKPIVIASYDAELFGHWWYEGPLWIDFLCRKLHYDQQTLKMITPLEYLAENPNNQQCTLSFSSWGRNGYGEVWLGHSNEWIYRHLHEMEECMIELATRLTNPSPIILRSLNQALRELLLAQSSDWAFIMDSKTMVDYAEKRTKGHIERFHTLSEAILRNEVEEEWLSELEHLNNIFPDIDYRVFSSVQRVNGLPIQLLNVKVTGLHVLMLSWEFPPLTVGGLSRHVIDLSKQLVLQGVNVHIITWSIDGYPSYECNHGIHVHRVRTYQAKELNFMDWSVLEPI
ncbi:MAG: 1,4-alpha-glucan branching protein domain-containing protein, partial [Bacilli bacterium]